MEIQLSSSWTKVGETWVRTPRDPDEFGRAIDSVSVDEIPQRLEGRRPPYAAVSVEGTTAYCVTDVTRSIPLYYTVGSDRTYVCDDAKWIRDRLSNPRCDRESVTQFLASGFVYGASTLLEEINQVPAGVVTAIDADTAKVTTVPHFDYEFDPHRHPNASPRETIEEGLSVAIDDLVADADGRQLVVPLSGGYDSRLLLLLLVERGYDNLLTYSHGREGNSEMTTARTVADSLNVEWVPITYTNEDWRRLRDDGTFEEYWMTAFNFDRLPGAVHMNWPAVRRLVESDRLDDDCIFLPGHTAVMMGEHLPDRYLSTQSVSREGLVDDLYRRTCSWLWSEIDDDVASTLRTTVRRSLNGADEYDLREAVTSYERWDWKERGAKWIHSDLDIYQFFDVGYRLPFWHPSFVEAWNSIPVEHRYDKRILREYADDLYADLSTGEGSIGTEADSPVRRAFYFVRDSPLRRLLQPLNSYLRYRRDPSAWPGIMQESTFRAVYAGHENRHTFFALDTLGLIDFETGYVSDAVRGGRLTTAAVDEAVDHCEDAFGSGDRLP